MNERNGSNIPMQLKSGVYTIELWVKGETHDKKVNPKIEGLATLSVNNQQARLEGRGCIH